MLTNCKLNGYLADLNEQAEDMLSQLVNELAEKDSIAKNSDQIIRFFGRRG